MFDVICSTLLGPAKPYFVFSFGMRETVPKGENFIGKHDGGEGMVEERGCESGRGGLQPTQIPLEEKMVLIVSMAVKMRGMPMPTKTCEN